ncbi:sensor histidine kinase [Microbacterium aurantiacum]|uniref:histidine kinase n=1 Tax=Microbacterium aurantiacum TaxID=162393 RepID=A0A0M8MEH7_9MICO|nr:ATP-binding protein [Microbacterium chocolatum]ANG86072.1 two-component sensor histidine kinase [Microbacterium chocolatum]KOS09818.1 histidine kinase [Microbacterium chocolatum]
MRRSRRPVSARVRILTAILTVAGIGLALVGGVTFLVQRQQVLAEIDDRLGNQVERLHSIAADGDPDAPSGPVSLTVDRYADVDAYLQEVVARLVPARTEASFAVVDGSAPIASSTLSGFDVSDDEAFVTRVREDTADGGIRRGTALTDAGTLRYIAIPVSVEGDTRTGVYVRAVDLDASLAPVTTAMTTYVVAGIVVLGVIGIVGWFVTGRLLSPIRHLRETAAAISLEDLSARLPTAGNDDISDLSRTVNSMLDRLEGSVDTQRQLLDDVRHELKTPITIVRGHLELMDPRDQADAAAAREIGIAELDRLARLVEDIDLLAAAEGEQYAMASVRLDQLTARLGELIAVIPDHRWSLAHVSRGRIIGDADRLLQAWLQLADNAAKYTPPGSPIEVGSVLDERGARLWVRDHGPGIPRAARHRIFRRFDRADTKRAVGGSGLGLAIVDAIAKGHGGSCSVDDTPGGGATFTIHLPQTTVDLPAPVRAGHVVMQREATA